MAVELAALTRGVAALAIVAAVIASAAMAGRTSWKRQSEFDDDWDTPLKQEDFDGMPLPENTESPVTSTQLTPVIVKVSGQRYGVPFTQASTKEKEKPGVKEFFLDNLVGASIGSLIALGSVAMVMMATKALLFAMGAILLTCLSSGWSGGAMQKSDKTGTVYEVVTKPQISHGHSYSSEVHYEPYTAPPPQPTVFKDFAYGYRHL